MPIHYSCLEARLVVECQNFKETPYPVSSLSIACLICVARLAAQPFKLRIPFFLVHVGRLRTGVDCAFCLVPQSHSKPEPRSFTQHPVIRQPISPAHYPPAPCSSRVLKKAVLGGGQVPDEVSGGRCGR